MILVATALHNFRGGSMLSPSYVTHIVIQILLGTLTPIILLAITQMVRLAEVRRKVIYATAGLSDTHRHLRPCAGTS